MEIKTKNILSRLNDYNFSDKLLLIFILLVPVMISPYLSQFAYKIQYSEIVFLLLFGTWFFRILSKRTVLKPVPLILPLVSMLVILLPSFINSQMRFKSAIEYTGIFYLATLYFLLVQLVSSQQRWWQIIKLWVIITFILTFTGVLAYIFFSLGVIRSSPLLYMHDILAQANINLTYRLTSLFRHPAMFATYLHVSLIFCFILLPKYHNKLKQSIFIWLVICLSILASLFTKTRVNAGIAVTLFLLFSVFPIKNKFVTLAKYISFLASIFLVVAVFFITVWWIFPIKINIDKKQNVIMTEFNFVHQSYFIQHKTALDMVKDYPFFGVGLGMYNYRSEKYVNWKEAKGPYRMMYLDLTEDREDLYKIGIDPHSTYLGWGAEAGLIGLGGILFFFMSFIYLLLKKIRVEAAKRYYYQCVLAGLIGFLLNAWFIDILTMRHLWILMAMGVAATLINFGDIRPEDEKGFKCVV